MTAIKIDIHIQDLSKKAGRVLPVCLGPCFERDIDVVPFLLNIMLQKRRNVRKADLKVSQLVIQSRAGSNLTHESTNFPFSNSHEARHHFNSNCQQDNKISTFGFANSQIINCFENEVLFAFWGISRRSRMSRYPPNVK